ncbi:glycosyltransferase [Flexibacterium corallicola]|uniref:glycosyltransferase n=1 Tax=Flexibacterium corallicola TaxID=3037259 RepID=UPI00286F75C6|nr:glycosyltransferase [Pseudovibrio sp. M1P-2-3]
MQYPPLKIFHCVRSPSGGILRHLEDLADQQAAAGHEVGIICDHPAGGSYDEERLSHLQKHLALGLHRLPIGREPSPADIMCVLRTRVILSRSQAQVVHGHGAKGGMLARFGAAMWPRARPAPLRIYSTHGGSLHFSQNTSQGKLYLQLERWQERHSDGLLFVCEQERRSYLEKIGPPACKNRVVHNGLRDEDFISVPCQQAATDFLYIGELRDLKGVDLLLHALKITSEKTGSPLTLTIVGDGPDKEKYLTLCHRLELNGQVNFTGHLPIKRALTHGRIAVVPSRQEAFPYIVLEMLAAGKPLLATDSGGIREIFSSTPYTLMEPYSLPSLAVSMEKALQPGYFSPHQIAKLTSLVKNRFSARHMAQQITEFYGVCFENIKVRNTSPQNIKNPQCLEPSATPIDNKSLSRTIDDQSSTIFSKFLNSTRNQRQHQSK